MAEEENSTNSGKTIALLHTRVDAAQRLLEDVYWSDEALKLSAGAGAAVFAALEMIKQANVDATDLVDCLRH